MGRVVEGEKVKNTLEAQHSIPETSRPGTSNVLWRAVEFIIGGIFIYAGIVKAMDPLQFAIDIDNYKILPWGIGMRLAFYLPWLEILCGLALIVRRLYAGALSILAALIVFWFANGLRRAPRD